MDKFVDYVGTMKLTFLLEVNAKINRFQTKFIIGAILCYWNVPAELIDVARLLLVAVQYRGILTAKNLQNDYQLIKRPDFCTHMMTSIRRLAVSFVYKLTILALLLLLAFSFFDGLQVLNCIQKDINSKPAPNEQFCISCPCQQADFCPQKEGRVDCIPPYVRAATLYTISRIIEVVTYFL